MSHWYEKKFIDVSITLKSKMVTWPGDPAVDVRRVKSIGKGSSCNLSSITMGVHSGTHMDAPFHFLPKGKSLDLMPINATIGPARIIKIKDRESIKPEELVGKRIRKGERILFKTANSHRCWKTDTFKKDFVHITKEAAAYLAKRRVSVVGIDYLSIGGFEKDGKEAHQALLKSGVWIIEGLNLAKVNEGRYEMICLPLKILKSDGAPARVVLYKK